MAERIADYCEAILTTEDLCKTGLRCCVSSDLYGDKIPSNVIIPNKTKTNYTKVEVKTTPKPSTTTLIAKTAATPAPARPKPCTGECVSGFFAIFCDDIDTEAECPAEGSCCITAPVIHPQNTPKISVKIMCLFRRLKADQSQRQVHVRRPEIQARDVPAPVSSTLWPPSANVRPF